MLPKETRGEETPRSVVGLVVSRDTGRFNALFVIGGVQEDLSARLIEQRSIRAEMEEEGEEEVEATEEEEEEEEAPSHERTEERIFRSGSGGCPP